MHWELFPSVKNGSMMSEDEPNKNLPTTADRAQEPAPLSSAEDIASSTLPSFESRSADLKK